MATPRKNVTLSLNRWYSGPSEIAGSSAVAMSTSTSSQRSLSSSIRSSIMLFMGVVSERRCCSSFFVSFSMTLTAFAARPARPSLSLSFVLSFISESCRLLESCTTVGTRSLEVMQEFLSTQEKSCNGRSVVLQCPSSVRVCGSKSVSNRKKQGFSREPGLRSRRSKETTKETRPCQTTRALVATAGHA